MSAAQVLEMIRPADPDSLVCEWGVWTAKWSPLGAPDLDCIVIEHAENIEIIQDWYEPDGLPGWVAVNFVVVR